MRLVDGEENPTLSLPEALRKAEETGLDLVEVAPQTQPPVVKLIDYKKFLFEEKRKQKTVSKAKKSSLKELRLRPTTGQGDMERYANRAREWLENKRQVKFTVQFRGRERSHPEVGREKLEQMVETLTDAGEVGKPIEQRGRFLSVILVPKK